MQDLLGSRQPSFALVLLGSYALAVATALIVSVSWIEGFVWMGGIVSIAWLALVFWAFSRFGARAAWTLLGLLVLNPATIFASGLTYACAAKAACL